MGFPKHVYKRGTGKAMDDSGLYSAESVLVNSEEALAKLEGEWCDSPVEAAVKAEPKPKPPKVK